MSEAPKFVEDMLGPPPTQKYIEDILGPEQVHKPTVWDGAFSDEYFSQQSPGKILDMFGQGAKQGWGDASPQIAPQVEDYLKSSGVIGDYKTGNQNLLRWFNEGLLRSTAAATDLFMRGTTSLYHGIGEALAPVVPRDIIAMPEAFIAGGPHIPHNAWPHLNPLDVAHDLKLTEEVAPGIQPNEAARQAFAPTGAPSRTERVVLPETEPSPAQALEPTTDVNAIARQIAPETFAEYDAHVTQKEQYRSLLAEMGESRKELPEAQAAQARIDDILGKVNGVEDRLTKAAAGRLAKAREDLDGLLRTDTPEMAAVRREMLASDERMRDMAPDVSAAYREAQARLPAPVEPIVPDADIIPFPTRPEPTAVEPPAAAPNIVTLAQRRPTIAVDIARQLQAAGRPADEARASAALVQAHYEARAARFNGALGSARDLYEKEDPLIQAGAGKARGRLDLVKNQITLFKDADASTFVHESAHQWLEEIRRDAQNPLAPPDLVADLQSVKEWLGATDTITRAQHERFARGFERYLMEGVAPNAKLAGVFAKFKDWLAKIYQSVSSLRAPINDQIRGVYDRLLSSPRSEAVVAPEREVGLNFADVHERDAATATPAFALARAEEMTAEREQIAQILRAEIMNGRRRARASASGTTARTGEEGAGVPGGPKQTTGAGAVREEPAAEPAAVSPSGAKFTVKGDIPEGQNDSFGPSDGRLIDKAGNIRLDNLNAPDEVDEIIRGAARYNEGYMEARRGTITDGQMIDLAEALGQDPSFLDRKVIGEAFSGEEVLAARKLLIQSSSDVRAKMAQVAEGGDPLELAKAIAKHEMIQGKVSQASAEWGRAGRAFRMLEEFTGDTEALNALLKENTGRSIDQLMQLARLGRNLNTPAQVSKFVSSTRGAVHPIVFYYWNSLISGPFTHAVYFAGNMLRAVGEPLLEVPLAATVSLATKDRVYFREVGASLYGMVKGFNDSLPMAMAAFKSGQQIPLPGQHGYGSAFGNFQNPIGGTLGTIIGIPGRSISAIHQLGMGIRYEQTIQRLALRDTLDKGLDGPAAEANIAKLTQSPTNAMMEEAGQHSLTEMYMRPSDFNSLSSALARTVHKTALGQIMFPFIKIGVEIQRETFIKHTPIGLADKEVRNALLGREGGVAFSEAAAKQLIGMGMLGLGATFAAQGLTTGFGPPDPNQRRAWLLTHQPYSVQIGNLWIPYQGLGPIGKLLQFGADSYEAVHFWDGEQSSKIATNYMSAIARAALDESIFHDMTDLNNAINSPSEHAARWLHNFVPGWLPYSSLLGQTNRKLFDPYSKEVNDTFDAIRAKIPVWSWQVPDRIDPFGNPILARGIHMNPYADDPVANHLDKLGAKIARLDKKISGVELTPEQHDDYARNAGVMTKQLLDSVVEKPGFAGAPHGIQLMEINRLAEAARARARAIVKMQSVGSDNDILQKGRELKLKALE